MKNNNEAFAIYDAQSKTLTFHKNNFVPNVGDIYTYTDDNGDIVEKQVTGICKDIESLVCEDYWDAPWEHYKTKIIYVEVVDKISPINTAYWFYGFYNCEVFKLNKLDTSNVKNMEHMFEAAGYYAEKFDLDLSSWNTSKVKDMSDMFQCAGHHAMAWNIKGLETWDVSNVINMLTMFSYAGYNAEYQLDLSSWDVSNATFYCYFNDGVENKVIAPTWNNNIKNNG